MNTLYYVGLENARLAWETVFLLSATDEAQVRSKARNLGMVGNAEDWQIAKVFPICTTPDDVEEELGIGS